MTSLVARTVPVHNMHATVINYDTYGHLSQPNLSGTQEFYYQKDSSAGMLSEVRHFQEAHGDGEESVRYTGAPDGRSDAASLKRKGGTAEEEPPATKLREDLFTPPQNKCGRLQIEIPGKKITVISYLSDVRLVEVFEAREVSFGNRQLNWSNIE